MMIMIKHIITKIFIRYGEPSAWYASNVPSYLNLVYLIWEIFLKLKKILFHFLRFSTNISEKIFKADKISYKLIMLTSLFTFWNMWLCIQINKTKSVSTSFKINFLFFGIFSFFLKLYYSIFHLIESKNFLTFS